MSKATHLRPNKPRTSAQDGAGAERFGPDFFAHYYHRRTTRVASARDYRLRAQLIIAQAALVRISIRRILDVGAGAGGFARAFDALLPNTRYTGIDVSAHACQRFGWTRASITEYAGRRPFDLVLCHDVFQYLTRNEALLAFNNLAALTHGLLYFTALTTEDWNDNCDQSRTDDDVYFRSARWYRRQLAPAFQQIGPGIFLTRGTRPLFALDSLS
jgi:predicted TPR repeat methyltransferase